MSSWALFTDELARWVDLGLIAQFWWRDDDAVADSQELARLIHADDGLRFGGRG